MRTRSRLTIALAAITAIAACSAPSITVTTERPIDAPSAADSATSDDTAPTTTSPVDESVEQPPATEAPATTHAVPTTPDLPPIIEPELHGDIPLSEVVNVGASKPASDADRLLALSVADLELWWADVFPELYGSDYEPLEGEIYAGYPSRDSDIPGCGTTVPTDPADLSLYVAFYCEFGDFMAYDASDDSLLTELASEYGDAVLGVVMAHEWGHAIQARIGAFDEFLPTIITEQQADCFAGAWVGRVYTGESDLLRFGDRDVRTSLVGMLSVSDPVGTDQFDSGGHGSAFDRVGAFQEGFTQGPQRCVPLLDEPLPLMPNEFRPQSLDAQLGGNAPYVCTELPAEQRPTCTPAPRFLGDDLNHFWETELGEFPSLIGRPVLSIDDADCVDPVRVDVNAALCAANRTVIYNEPEVLDLYREFGDFTLGYLYGIAWADLALDQMGFEITGERRALVRDCFVGAWAANITPDAAGNTPRSGDRDGDGLDDGVTISPGDLDEAIRMAILVGDEGFNVNEVGSPFEKIDWFRNGVLGNVQTCTGRAGLS